MPHTLRHQRIDFAGGDLAYYLSDPGLVAVVPSTSTGRVIGQAAANNLIPATLELGGKSPNIFFADVMDKDDGFLDKAIEGMVLFAFNQGEVCTCPSRALIQESIYDKFMGRCLERIAARRIVDAFRFDDLIDILERAGVVTRVAAMAQCASAG